MSDAGVQEFFTRLQQDRELAREYKGALDQAIESVVGPTILEVAARNGSTFSADELSAYLAQRSSELDDDQLDAVAGGLSMWTGGGFMTSPWLVAALIPAAISVPLALGDHDDAS